ncbi:response regulator [Yoonia sediminilitoris]|uniref:Response regulator receiver domain-containing protein n=1 Tax=Yoonia sediminilitoris TaxID=1286148 RepID=A0A2T6KFS4_9RHOB|nr:response regulator [Yoonia sediminilitoris]PUB14161.1 response regulator receiver domain-containing protein [Yoonia sediminilitoris]RCW95092.1 response regulator receiver domain-containing protein [Yoonia sediminilitoris]
MHVLIVQSNAELGKIWKRHLERLNARVVHVETGQHALALVQSDSFDVVVIDLVLKEGSPLTVADFVQFRQPRANVVFVTDTTFFSDGSIFSHSANARALIETATPPADLAAIVHHYGCPSHAGVERAS